MRKEADFEVMDHIKVSLSGNDKLYAIVEKNSAAITGKVLAESIEANASFSVSKDWDINGEKVNISIEKLS